MVPRRARPEGRKVFFWKKSIIIREKCQLLVRLPPPVKVQFYPEFSGNSLVPAGGTKRRQAAPMLRFVLRHVVFSAVLGVIGNDLVSGTVVQRRVAAVPGRAASHRVWQGCAHQNSKAEACRTLRLRGAGTAKVVVKREEGTDAGGTEDAWVDVL